MFLGPVCEYVIAPVARYAAIWGVPVVTPTAQANAFLDKQHQFRTLTRIMGSAHQLGTVFRPIMNKFNWEVAGLVYEDYGSSAHKGLHKCNFMLQAVYQGMEIKPSHQSFLSNSTRREFVGLLRQLVHSARSEYWDIDVTVLPSGGYLPCGNKAKSFFTGNDKQIREVSERSSLLASRIRKQSK